MLDRLYALGIVVLVQLLLMLDVSATPLGTMLTPTGVAVLIGVNTVLLSAWMLWASPATRIDAAVRSIGAIVLVTTVSMWLPGWSNTTENAALACLGSILLVTGLKGRRAGKATVASSLTP